MMPTADRFAPFRLSLSDLPEKNRAEALRELYGRTMVKHDIEPLTDGVPQFEATLWALPGLGLSSVNCSSFHVWRTRDQIDSDDLVLNVTLAGGRSQRQHGREANIAEGEAVLLTCAATGDAIVSPETRFVSFRMPRDMLTPMVTDPHAGLCQTIPRNTAALHLLVSYANSLRNARALATPELRRLVTTHIYDLAALAIGATRDTAETARGRGVRAARLAAVKTDILANMLQPGLSIDAIAVRQGISPVYVRKLFEGDGTTFTEFILTQRLTRAHRMLGDPRFAGSTISAIAYDVGFADLSYFNRVFRRCYGITPSDVRANARREKRN